MTLWMHYISIYEKIQSSATLTRLNSFTTLNLCYILKFPYNSQLNRRLLPDFYPPQSSRFLPSFVPPPPLLACVLPFLSTSTIQSPLNSFPINAIFPILSPHALPWNSESLSIMTLSLSHMERQSSRFNAKQIRVILALGNAFSRFFRHSLTMLC